MIKISKLVTIVLLAGLVEGTLLAASTSSDKVGDAIEGSRAMVGRLLRQDSPPEVVIKTAKRDLSALLNKLENDFYEYELKFRDEFRKFELDWNGMSRETRLEIYAKTGLSLVAGAVVIAALCVVTKQMHKQMSDAAHKRLFLQGCESDKDSLGALAVAFKKNNNVLCAKDFLNYLKTYSQCPAFASTSWLIFTSYRCMEDLTVADIRSQARKELAAHMVKVEHLLHMYPDMYYELVYTLENENPSYHVAGESMMDGFKAMVEYIVQHEGKDAVVEYASHLTIFERPSFLSVAIVPYAVNNVIDASKWVVGDYRKRSRRLFYKYILECAALTTLINADYSQ